MNRAPRIILFSALVLGLLLVLVVAAVFYIGLTGTGTSWVLERVRSSINAEPGSSVQWRDAQGTLLTGLEVRDFVFATTTETGPIEVKISSLSFSWQPLGLLKYAVVIDPVQIEGLSYTAEGDAPDTPPMTADELRSRLFGLPVSIELQNVAARNIAWRLNTSSFAIDSLTGSAALNEDRLQLTGLRVQQDASEVSGDIRLDNTLAAEGKVVWQTRIDERQYSGELMISGDLQELQLAHVLAEPLQINSDGVLSPGFLAGPELSLNFRHGFTALDLTAFGQEGVILRNGEIDTTGSPDSLAITGVLQGQIRDLDLLTLNLNLLYQPEALTFNSLQLDSSQIAMTAVGSLQLEPRVLQLDWRVTNLDPGAALPQVRLTEVTGEGSVLMSSAVPGDQQITLTLTRVDGRLNDLPLGISGVAEVTNSQLSAVDLQVNSGDNSFSIAGTAAEALMLDWQLQAPQLQQLWQGLDGALVGQGSVGGTIEMPELDGELNGRQISLQIEDGSVILQSLQLTANASAANNDIKLSLGAVSMQSSAVNTAAQPILEQATLSLVGTPAQHTVNADLSLADADVTLELAGGVSAENWNGILQDSSITGSYGNWQQENAFGLAYESDALTVEQGCWTYVTVRLCLNGGKPANAGFNANLSLNNIPLAWLDVAAASEIQSPTPKPPVLQEIQDANGVSLPLGLQVEGDVDVQLALTNFAGGSWDSLDVNVVPENTVLVVDFSEGSVSETAESAVERFNLAANTLHASNSAGVWAAEVDLSISKQTAIGDALQGSLSAQLSMSPSEELEGELAFGFNELGWIETVAPRVREPYGSFNGRVVIAGTKSAPLLSGQLRMADAGFGLPDYGLVVSDIDLLLQNQANNEFVLEGSAKSGDGSLAINTTFSNLSSENRVMTAEITGTDFSVINTSYARANISPQLQVSFANAELTLSGGIILPLLDLDLEAMFATAGRDGVDVSRDVVVLNATEEDAVATDSQTVAIPLNADISLLLGENVRLRGYGLNTRLNGELTLEQAPSRPVLVYGELGIPEGSFEIYNQVLNAKDGRLMFFGNPANPVVDIRAFRETDNNTEVGMLLSGNIKNMQGTLYSSPNLPEDEILSLLITGKSFNSINDQDGNALLGAIANFGFERSDGLTSKVSSKLGFDSFGVEGGSTLEDSALGLGKYITPDLLLRYKVGLFDRQSALSIDYNLTEHIKLEVETGISQSVDISYTIETD